MKIRMRVEIIIDIPIRFKTKQERNDYCGELLDKKRKLWMYSERDCCNVGTVTVTGVDLPVIKN